MLEKLGSYKILEQIGTGPGEVYRARDSRVGRTVVVRVVPASLISDDDSRARFFLAARAACELSHPNIAAVFDVGQDADRVFLASEFVPGETLRTVLAGRALNPRRAIDVAVEVADALATAHGAGIVHGSLSSETILMARSGRAKVLDFNLAAWTGRSGAPGSDAVEDRRGDLAALGALLFEMLTGRPPAGRLTPSAVIPSLPRQVDRVVMRAVGRGAGENRYDSAAALAADLRGVAAALRQPDEPLPAVRRAASGSGRRSYGWLLLIAVGAVLAAAAWWWVI